MKTEKIDIEIKTETLERTGIGLFIGEIYFVTEKGIFPEEGWTDFAVRIIPWWYNSLIRLIQSKPNSEEEFDFMDGPMKVRVLKLSDEIIELKFIESRTKGEILNFTINTSIKEFKGTLLKSGEKLLIDLNEINLKIDDYNEDDIIELMRTHHYLLNMAE